MNGIPVSRLFVIWLSIFRGPYRIELEQDLYLDAFIFLFVLVSNDLPSRLVSVNVALPKQGTGTELAYCPKMYKYCE